MCSVMSVSLSTRVSHVNITHYAIDHLIIQGLPSSTPAPLDIFELVQLGPGPTGTHVHPRHVQTRLDCWQASGWHLTEMPLFLKIRRIQSTLKPRSGNVSRTQNLRPLFDFVKTTKFLWLKKSCSLYVQLQEFLKTSLPFHIILA